MGVAREFGPWALNAREFRRAGLNPRVWLARRVNQSATDAVGGAVIFSVNVAEPSPLDAAALSPGGADPLSSTDPLFSLSWGPLRRRGPPLFHGPSLYCRGPLPTIPSSGRRGPPPPPLFLGPLPPSARTLPHHSAVRRRGPLPTIPPSVGADPLPSMDSPHHSAIRRCGPPPFYGLSPPFRRPSARTPSLSRTPPLFHCRGPLPTIPSPVDADPLSPSARTPSLPRTPPHYSVVSRHGSSSFHCRARVLLRESRGCARGRGVGKTSLKMVLETKFICRSA
ncbi:hypothetical protein niasHT_017982 [Heterodera trifolii]|uniref:Uncharacterized protein n=1 Tax=Heterodera trifolii TaxID=157864 RepID=A0ABD2LD44_9BILA